MQWLYARRGRGHIVFKKVHDIAGGQSVPTIILSSIVTDISSKYNPVRFSFLNKTDSEEAFIAH